MKANRDMMMKTIHLAVMLSLAAGPMLGGCVEKEIAAPDAARPQPAVEAQPAAAGVAEAAVNSEGPPLAGQLETAPRTAAAVAATAALSGQAESGAVVPVAVVAPAAAALPGEESAAAGEAEAEPEPDFSTTAAAALADIAAGKVIAFVQFTDFEGEQTPFSQAVFQEVEPIVVAEGLRRDLQFIERTDLKLILDEWDLSSMFGGGGGDSGAQTLLGADYILTGKARPAGRHVQCSLKLVDLGDGRIVSSVAGSIAVERSGLAAAVPAASPGAPPPPGAKPANRAVSDDQRLAVWTSKPSYAIGERIEIAFRVEEPLYVEILNVTPEGKITRIFPNPVQTDNYCLPGRTYRIPPASGGFELIVTPPTGVDRLKAVASSTPIDNPALVKTRGIAFTRTLVDSSETRANLAFTIR